MKRPPVFLDMVIAIPTASVRVYAFLFPQPRERRYLPRLRRDRPDATRLPVHLCFQPTQFARVVVLGVRERR